ncbi:type II toxin-antitoxin system RelE/ParE family toxin [Kosakonia sacchari]|uniref:type II toxin-antitoxin system RelE/ParE family toxin n=1 Tax=Kosakonia sacchari TaxID=1158459 RepID=UPI002ACECD76|nr:type II toxin-antitoxin system RelE/ParE family toxin [Kosakonia sacchari]MDZ7320083.1 type II toxin-antitoxin system RelE/ParE family toxin [Kosakonia sacchari]
MKEIKLTPKAEDDLAAIWNYSYRHFGMEQADIYIGRISAVFEVLGTHQVGTSRPELGEQFFALPVEQHIIFFIPTETVITIVRILSQSQDTARHLPWR